VTAASPRAVLYFTLPMDKRRSVDLGRVLASQKASRRVELGARAPAPAPPGVVQGKAPDTLPTNGTAAGHAEPVSNGVAHGRPAPAAGGGGRQGPADGAGAARSPV
jgi:hypothetical protein